MSIIVNALSYIHPNKETLFSNINLSIAKGQKASLIGNNGTGKSTLLKILAGELEQSAGSILLPEKPYYVPQHLGQYDNHTLAQALGVADKVNALHAILEGDASAENFKLLDDDWDIEERINTALAFWKIQHLPLSQTMAQLSGGEKTKVFLAGILIHLPQIILLDEPTNHLDHESRTLLYHFIGKSKSTILTVSHDRTLLNLLDMTMELTSNSVEVYGGNYDFYKEQKDGKLLALQNQLNEKEKTIRQARQNMREIAQQRQKQEVRGKKQQASAGMARIVAGALGSKAENSSAKLKDVHTDKINAIAEDMTQIRQQIQTQKTLKIDLRKSELHKGKILIEAKNINFAYNENLLWQSPLNFQIQSGSRVRIIGNNGTGKTTLVKILTSTLHPTEGHIFIADFRHLYIDQEYSIIDNRLSVFEQVQQFNDRHLPEHDLKMLLHYHQFTQDVWDQQCASLSGGEKMKLILCCIAVSNNSLDMLILDEPTNNLDLFSQDILTEAISNFEGTLVVISHDRYFAEALNMEQEITLS
ncbi:ATPase subunit of ABC transporter with duplicated ATPase domains [Dysgonomonas sp. PH5-45]|uniref:ABC-F family ATP-binding cassette domain-containing protein n=1 Tax=unclassified Dysgonomonas TaxID=2630389 RepID=UPI002476EA08|nr:MULTISPECIES: ABC-F family ATP-binding cassette domain-containing protein [unclassified Dysgonomonas]MDH6354839.1 ATPase subunit of ABC transporter with duplicated ATPase domains [Dysgonomonas sp. PH5-45]MDH6387738.1 ATPase subunit of ABC transporter with duplicated ATPase domains [Dysgonomonas sp. PH5-37]